MSECESLASQQVASNLLRVERRHLARCHDVNMYVDAGNVVVAVVALSAPNYFLHATLCPHFTSHTHTHALVIRHQQRQRQRHRRRHRHRNRHRCVDVVAVVVVMLNPCSDSGADERVSNRFACLLICSQSLSLSLLLSTSTAPAAAFDRKALDSCFSHRAYNARKYMRVCVCV